MAAKKALTPRAGLSRDATHPTATHHPAPFRSTGPALRLSTSTPRELSVAVQALQAADRLTEPDQFLTHLDELRKEKRLTFDRLGRMCQLRPILKMSRSGIYTMLTRKQWPTHQQMAAFLYLCDVSPHEYSIWLTEHARGRGSPDPDFAPESVLQPQPEPPRHQPPRVADHPTPPPRPVRFRRWHQRSSLHFAFSVFGAVVVVTTVGVIALHMIGIPSQLIAMACIAAAAGVLTWTYARLNPDTERLSAYAYTDPEVFENHTLTAPPVIGD